MGQRPRRVPASRHEQRQVRRWPLDEPYQPVVHLGRPDLVQVVQDEGDRTAREAECGRHHPRQVVRLDGARGDPSQRLARRCLHDRHQRGRDRAPEGVRVVVGLVEVHPRQHPFGAPAASQDAAKIVLPHPAVGRDHRHRRRRPARRTEDAGVTDRRRWSPPAVRTSPPSTRSPSGSSPAGRSQLIPAPPRMGTRPGNDRRSTVGNECMIRVRGRLSPDVLTALHPLRPVVLGPRPSCGVPRRPGRAARDHRSPRGPPVALVALQRLPDNRSAVLGEGASPTRTRSRP